jgi:hypothetical protein
MVEPMKPPMAAPEKPRMAPPNAPPIAEPTAPRTKLPCVGSQCCCGNRKAKAILRAHDRGQDFLDDAQPFIGVDETVGAGQDPDMLGDGARCHAEQDSAPGPASVGAISGIIWPAPSASTSRGPVSPQSRL